MTTLVWLRNDLRLKDNPALYYAAQQGRIEAVFCVCREQWDEHDVGEPRLAFLLRSLEALASRLAGLGVPLHVLETAKFSDVPDALKQLAKKIDAPYIAFNDEYPWNERQRDEAVVEMAEGTDVEVQRFVGGVTLAPGTVLTQEDQPYKVFTPFSKRWKELVDPMLVEPLPQPQPQGKRIAATEISGFDDIDASLFKEDFPAGEDAAHERLQSFLDEAIGEYNDKRDFPAIDGTSRLSAYLSVGTLSSNQCLHAVNERSATRGEKKGEETWVSELIWREFYRHVMYLFPRVGRGQPFQAHTRAVAWRQDSDGLTAWKEGRTGYPLVDAAMRQLNETGYMHNRLRMVAAMFLTKHLLVHWCEGEAYFMRKLVDGDFAANNGGWQWSASTGTDAAPYFRIFNPASQGERFDKKGEFTRKWVPELADVPDKYLYEPHKWTDGEVDYPEPIVDHKEARERAIEAFKAASDEKG